MNTRMLLPPLVLFFCVVACFVGCSAATAGAGSRAEPLLARHARTPEPIYAHNLSLDKRWADDARADYLPVLEEIVGVARDAGYRRVLLARALPRDEWVHRKGAEPLEQFAPLSSARQRAMESIVERHPEIEFSTHLGYERLDEMRARQAAAWEDPAYVQTIEREIRRWNDLGYFVWMEGLGGPVQGGREWFESKPDDLRVGGIVWPMDAKGRLVYSEQSPMLAMVDFLAGKFDRGQAEQGRLFPDEAERYVAINMRSVDHLIEDGRTSPSPVLASLLERPNVGLVSFGTGRKDQRIHERVMELHRRRLAE